MNIILVSSVYLFEIFSQFKLLKNNSCLLFYLNQKGKWKVKSNHSVFDLIKLMGKKPKCFFFCI